MSEKKSAINGSLPNAAVEGWYYEARFHDQKRAFTNGQFPVNVSIQYDSEELEPEDVELVEQLFAWMLFDPVRRHC